MFPCQKFINSTIKSKIINHEDSGQQNFLICSTSKMFFNKASNHNFGKQCIVMEIAEKGSLKSLINQREMDKAPFSEKEIFIMFANIAFSLLEVNRRGIFHRDLKPDNMLI